MATSASCKFGIMRKAFYLFGDPVFVLRCFWGFQLHRLQYCSLVWMSAATSHLVLLNLFVSKAVRLGDGLVVCDLEHRRRVAALSMFYKIHCNPNHTL